MDRSWAWGLVILTACALLRGDSMPPDVAAQKAGLADFNALIGGWRGVGQVRRSSTSGAWTETAEWVWHFGPQEVAVDYVVKNGKLFESGRLSYSPATKEYTLAAVLPDKSKQTLVGTKDGNKLVLTTMEKDAAQKETAEIHRMTITRLSPIRTLVLFEKRTPVQERFSRVAEVGYTRADAHLAREGGNGPECVVTGGVGTIMVMHKGKTYYVCCTGCKQAFEDDPEGILAEYFAQKKAAK